jgi:glycosyltransferase involved in cell wall biosynthesis
MSVQEGLDILLEVALHIQDLGRSDIHFTCVGGGPELPGLRQIVQEKNLTDIVNLTGRIRTSSCWRYCPPPTSVSTRTGLAT